MKKIITLLFLVTCIPVWLNAQNINGRITSSVYSFERHEASGVSNKYNRTFQMLNLNVSQGDFTLRTNFNLENDFSQKMDFDPRLRFNHLYLEARNLLDVATVRLGRQPLFAGVASGLFDGLSLNTRFSNYRVFAYFGGNVPEYQKLELTDQFDKDFVAGGKITALFFDNLQVGLGYVNKHFKPTEYNAIRLDDNFNPINVLVQRDSDQFQYLSGDISYVMPDYFSVDAKYDYDMNFKTTSKFEMLGRYDQVENLGISLYYNFRKPTIRYNSYFAMFNVYNTQEIEAGVDYQIGNLMTITGKFGNVIYEDDNSQRITIGASSKNASIQYRKSLGYAGELDAISVHGAYTFFDGLLTPSLGVGYTGYKLSKDSEKQDVTSFLAGVNVRPWRELSFDVQGQLLNNKIYKNDYRVFFRINYWFNTNLNLM